MSGDWLPYVTERPQVSSAPSIHAVYNAQAKHEEAPAAPAHVPVPDGFVKGASGVTRLSIVPMLRARQLRIGEGG